MHCSCEDLFLIGSSLIFINGAGTEVNDFKGTVGGYVLEDDVLWFQIAMDNLFGMAIIDSIKYLIHKSTCHGLSDILLSLDLFKQLPARAIFHHDVYPRIIDVDLVNTNYILVGLHRETSTKFLSIFI